eukprot:1233868-Rhodomonas_salina.2
MALCPNNNTLRSRRPASIAGSTAVSAFALRSRYTRSCRPWKRPVGTASRRLPPRSRKRSAEAPWKSPALTLTSAFRFMSTSLSAGSPSKRVGGSVESALSLRRSTARLVSPSNMVKDAELLHPCHEARGDRRKALVGDYHGAAVCTARAQPLQLRPAGLHVEATPAALLVHHSRVAEAYGRQLRLTPVVGMGARRAQRLAADARLHHARAIPNLPSIRARSIDDTPPCAGWLPVLPGRRTHTRPVGPLPMRRCSARLQPDPGFDGRCSLAALQALHGADVCGAAHDRELPAPLVARGRRCLLLHRHAQHQPTQPLRLRQPIARGRRRREGQRHKRLLAQEVRVPDVAVAHRHDRGSRVVAPPVERHALGPTVRAARRGVRELPAAVQRVGHRELGAIDVAVHVVAGVRGRRGQVPARAPVDADLVGVAAVKVVEDGVPVAVSVVFGASEVSAGESCRRTEGRERVRGRLFAHPLLVGIAAVVGREGQTTDVVVTRGDA